MHLQPGHDVLDIHRCMARATVLILLPASVAALTMTSSQRRHHALELRDRGYTVIPDSVVHPRAVKEAAAACSADFARLIDMVSGLGIDPIDDKYAFDEIDKRHRNRWNFRPSSDSSPLRQIYRSTIPVATSVIEMMHTLPPNPDDGYMPELTGWTRHLLPPKAEAQEYGCILSRPGAQAQKFHADAGGQHYQYSRLCPRHRLIVAGGVSSNPARVGPVTPRALHASSTAHLDPRLPCALDSRSIRVPLNARTCLCRWST